jgi:hypothetical protein
MHDADIGKNVQALRGDTSQAALASSMRERGHKWSQATVWSVEKGDRPLRVVEALDLASIFNEPIDLLFLPSDDATTVHLMESSSRYLIGKMEELERAAVLFLESRYNEEYLKTTHDEYLEDSDIVPDVRRAYEIYLDVLDESDPARVSRRIAHKFVKELTRPGNPFAYPDHTPPEKWLENVIESITKELEGYLAKRDKK